MKTGRVKMWNADRGFGFIACEGEADFFCHVSEVTNADALDRGWTVEFEPGVNPRTNRPQAVKVRVVDGGASREADRVFRSSTLMRDSA